MSTYPRNSKITNKITAHLCGDDLVSKAQPANYFVQSLLLIPIILPVVTDYDTPEHPCYYFANKLLREKVSLHPFLKGSAIKKKTHSR